MNSPTWTALPLPGAPLGAVANTAPGDLPSLCFNHRCSEWTLAATRHQGEGLSPSSVLEGLADEGEASTAVRDLHRFRSGLPALPALPAGRAFPPFSKFSLWSPFLCELGFPGALGRLQEESHPRVWGASSIVYLEPYSALN